MGDLDHDFILRDIEYKRFKEQSNAFAAGLEETLDGYLSIIDSVLTYGVSSGRVHEAVVTYRGYVARLLDMTRGLGEWLDRLIDDFIKSVEQADGYLYDGSAVLESAERDFSAAEYEKLMKFLTSNWYYGIGEMSAWDWITSTVVNIITFILPITKAYFQSCRNMLMDQHNESARHLTMVFNNAIALDTTYGQHFESVASAMESILRAVREMNALFADGSFTAEAVNHRLGHIFDALDASMVNINAIKTISSEPSVEAIGQFADNDWAPNYFDACVSNIVYFTDNIDWMDALGMSVFEFDMLVKGELFHGDVNEYNTRQYLMSVLNGMADTELYGDSDSQEGIENARILLKYYGKFGDKFYDYLDEMRMPDGSLFLDGRTIQAKEFEKAFKQFQDSHGTAKIILEILKYGDDAIEFVARALADYSEGLELLESLERNIAGDETVASAIAEIKALYNNEFNTWMAQAVEEGGEESFDFLIGKLGKTPLYKTLFMEIEATKKAIDIYGDSSGLGDRAKGIYDFTIYHGLYTSSNAAYATAIERLRMANPDDADYEQLARDAQNCFNICKQNALKVFESMEKASMSNMKAYYRYCQDQIRNANMFDTRPLEAMSYDEYLTIKA